MYRSSVLAVCREGVSYLPIALHTIWKISGIINAIGGYHFNRVFTRNLLFFLDQCHVIDSLTDTGCLQLIPFLILVTRASTGYMEMSVSIPFVMCGFSYIIALYSTHQYIVVLEENIQCHTKNVKIQSQAIVSITISLIPKHQIFRAPCGLVKK